MNDQTSRQRPRAGFTAIEMMVVVTIIIVLVAMVVPTIGPAMKKGSVHDAASAIQRACSQARQLARSTSEPRTTPGVLAPHYGVAVVVPREPNKPAYAVVVYGNTNLSNNYSFANNEENQYPNGTPDLSGVGTISGLRPASKFQFNRGVMPVTGTGASYNLMNVGDVVGWYYQYRTGFVFKEVSRSTVAVDIGVPARPGFPVTLPEAFGVASLDMKYIVAVAVYKIGLLNAQDVN